MQKKFLLLGVLFMGVLVSTTAFAIDPMGPPAATIDKGGWSIGVESSYTETDIKRQLDRGSSACSNAEIEMLRVYANLSYGISENVTGFVRLGGATMEWERIPGRSYDWQGTDGDWDFAWGAGVRATLSESDNVSWGFVGQFSQADLTGKQVDKYNDDEGGYKIEMAEFQFAIGPTVKVSDSVRVYGGPFIDIVTGTWSDNIWDTYRLRKPIEETDWWGGYLGTAIDLSKNSYLNVEGMVTQAGWAVAGGVMWRCK